MIAVSQARYLDGYRVWLEFSDGSTGIVDLADVIDKYPQAQPLKDLERFKAFYLDEWPTLPWPCGFDLSPESLYERATGCLLSCDENSAAASCSYK